MIVKLLNEHHVEFLSLKGGLSESTLFKMSYCWKSHAAAHLGAAKAQTSLHIYVQSSQHWLLPYTKC